MKIVFVSGPYRGRSADEVDANIARARLRAADALAAGHLPVTPHLLSAGLVAPEQTWLLGSCELARRCDEVWLVEGWERSMGALEEIAEALDADLPVLLPDGARLYGVKYLPVVEALVSGSESAA